MPPQRGLWVLWDTTRGLCPPQHRLWAPLGSCSSWKVKITIPDLYPALSPMVPMPINHGHLQVPKTPIPAHSRISQAWVVLQNRVPSPETAAQSQRLPNPKRGSSALPLEPRRPGSAASIPLEIHILCSASSFALTTLLPGTSRAPGLILAPDNCCTSSGAEGPRCIGGVPAQGNASIPAGCGAGGQHCPSCAPAVPQHPGPAPPTAPAPRDEPRKGRAP